MLAYFSFRGEGATWALPLVRALGAARAPGALVDDLRTLVGPQRDFKGPRGPKVSIGTWTQRGFKRKSIVFFSFRAHSIGSGPKGLGWGTFHVEKVVLCVCLV